MDRLALVRRIFGREPPLFVPLEAAELILGNVPSVFSWVADRMLVTQVAVFEARFNAPHL